MRPTRITATIASANAAGYASAITGAIQTTAWTSIISSPNDGLAHQTTLYEGTNLSGINITVTGLDGNNRSFSEVIAGPNATTTNLLNYFASVTAISANATLGASTMSCGWTGTAVTSTIPVNPYTHAGPAVIMTAGGTGYASVRVDQTVTPVFNTSASATNWYSLISLGSTGIGQGDAGITAIRGFAGSAGTSSTITLDIAQSRD